MVTTGASSASSSNASSSLSSEEEQSLKKCSNSHISTAAKITHQLDDSNDSSDHEGGAFDDLVDYTKMNTQTPRAKTASNQAMAVTVGPPPALMMSLTEAQLQQL
jgi:hypothetical protein